MNAGTAEYWKNKGNDSLKQKKIIEAIKFYQKSLLIDSKYTPSWHNLGLICEKIGLIEEANYCYSEEKRLTENLSDSDLIDDVNTIDSTDENEKNVVYLDAIDGFEFEQICGEIYRNLGYQVEVTPPTQDVGRDLELIAPNGEKIVVECKHQIDNTIGRPVVQKLHSSAITHGAIKGILITTGKFSNEAIEHAKILTPKIELIDRPLLIDLATSANYEFYLRGEKQKIWSYPISSILMIKDAIFNNLKENLTSFPLPISVIKITNRQIELDPSYKLTYNIDSRFYTTIGLIHHERSLNQNILFEGNTGQVLNSLNTFLSNSSFHEFNQSLYHHSNIRKQNFSIDGNTLKNIAKDHIAKKHTKNVSYYGNNNQRYTKECIPGQREIIIKNIRQIFIPKQKITINSHKKAYFLDIIENSSEMMCKTNLLTCSFCNGYTNGKKMILCNSCGSITHAPFFFDTCSYTCQECGKTICRTCTFQVKKKGKLCNECAKRYSDSVKPVGKFLYQKYFIAGILSVVGLILLQYSPIFLLLFLGCACIILYSSIKKKTPEYIFLKK